MIDQKTQNCISCIHCCCNCRWYCNDHAEELYENELLDENDCADYHRWDNINNIDTVAVVTSDEEHTYNVGFLEIEEKEI